MAWCWSVRCSSAAPPACTTTPPWCSRRTAPCSAILLHPGRHRVHPDRHLGGPPRRAGLLGPVVPGSGAPDGAGRCRTAALPHRDRLGPGLRAGREDPPA
ncbi:hypothetical protein G6F66_015025 [Rhizopus arrhizus]|nr:hypothetical protein G6F66_015025 [Rhizopus arrhizus]